MKKRVIQSCVVFAILIVFVNSDMAALNNSNAIAVYVGKWKVTKQLTEYFRNKTTFFPHHYLGRTVILGETSVEQSIFEWPYDLDWTREVYDSSEVACFSKDDPWILGNVAGDFDEFVESEEVQFIRYLNKGIDESTYCANKFIVLDNTHLARFFIGGYYLLEPFQYCDPKTSSDDLIGTWEIAYLDSYEDSYEGGFEDIEKLKTYGRAMREQMSALIGTDFAAEQWLGKTVQISEETISFSELSFQIREVEENRVSRENFEKEKGIHDGLSIYDDELNVCDIKCDDGEDIICVLVNKDNVIIHIEQGWFMLKRQQ